MTEPDSNLWNATDVIYQPDLPRRRLVVAASGDSLWLIFYERGGFVKTSNVAIFRQSPAGIEPVGNLYIKPGITDPASLSRFVNSESMLDERGY